MATQLIGRRIKALREERKLSQDRLAERFGFKDRQTVSAIETGVVRRPAPGEHLARGCGHLEPPVRGPSLRPHAAQEQGDLVPFPT